MFNLVSVDGYFADTDGGLEWQITDKEFDKAATEMSQRFDTILFGRNTYELFKSYWPNALTAPETSPEDRAIAQKIDEMTKIVFSTKAIDTGWRNTRHISEITADAIEELKAADGNDIVIYGSGTIVQQLTRLRLIDEYQFMVNPVILGSGKLLFQDADRVDLKIIDSVRFGSGNLLLRYEAA
jgi:dihydrofolate reductase